MKKRKLLAVGVLAAVFAVAAPTFGTGPEGSEARREDDGGMVVLWPKDAGRFVFVNAQGRVPAGDLSAPVAHLGVEFNIDARLVAGRAPDLRAASEELGRLGAKGAVWVVDDPKLPLVLAAAEDGWGVLNVAPLLADGPSAEKSRVRVAREVNRLFGMLHGCYSTMMIPQCVMRPVHSPAGLDSLVSTGFSPESYTKIARFLDDAGYLHARRNTYAGACREGWAPSPTNGVQRAIWERVQADKERGPSNPIRILPPSQKK